MTGPARRATALCALLTSTFIATQAFGQLAADPSFPRAETVDANGIDVVRRSFVHSTVDLTIGSGAGELRLERRFEGLAFSTAPDRTMMPIFTFNSFVALPHSGEYYIRLPHRSVQITSTLNTSFGGAFDPNTSTYTDHDGTIYRFQHYSGTPEDNNIVAWLTQIVRPDGTTIDIQWGQTMYTDVAGSYMYDRIEAVRNNSGYMLRFEYSADVEPVPGWSDFDHMVSGRWNELSRVIAFNRNFETCDPTVAPCTLSSAWPVTTFSFPHNSAGYRADAGTMTVARPAGRVLTYTQNASAELTIALNGEQQVRVYNSGLYTSTVVRNGVSWIYTSLDANRLRVTDALGHNIVYASSSGLLDTITDQLNRVTDFDYDSQGRLQRVTRPLGNAVAYSYDARSNVVQTQLVAKPGSGSATITTSAAYPATCTNAVTCNLPTSTTDARGFVTDYTYSATHGGVLTETAPAVTVNGQSVRPQVRTTYSQSGGVTLPTQVSACRTTASCAGTADEVRTTITYGANHLPVSTSSGNGTGTLTATTAMTYDEVGNLVTVDGPLTGTADTVRYRYDSARRPVGMVSPDPDGSGPLPPRAVRTTYRPDDQVSLSETGIVNSQSDADWAAMVVLEQVNAGFDSNQRPVVSTHSGGGAIHSVVQTSYDALGRPDCVAQRMNPATWLSLPASACTLQAVGTYGPDRIGRTVRNAAGEVTQSQTAVGTTLQATVVTATYSNNGLPLTVTDGENNRTSYQYDGHDRLTRTYFPLVAQGANGSNAADYEEIGYDPGGNVVSRTSRAGQTIGYTYDARGNMTFRDMPEFDLAYSYDLLGRLVRVRDFEPYWGSNGYYFALSYDALGRLVSQTGHHGSTQMQYDLAGRRTRLTYPDGYYGIPYGYYIEYDHLVTGEISRIRENGATSGVGVIATYGYDYLGRRTSLTRGNGTVASYAYDAGSRLSQLSDNMAGSANDFTLGFSYNPAGQIVSNSRSNDLYSVTPAASTTNATANGLNQISGQNGTNFTHDANGNLLSDGTRTYQYRSDNRLSHASGNLLRYDPLDRFNHSWYNNDGFDYDGHNLIVYRNGSTGPVYERYVHGPGADEPLMAIAANGSNRRFLHADERGSIVAVSDSSGNVTAVNRYDEYGTPASGNSGFFQYAGQPWLAPFGGEVYYSRARMYDPRLGRFLQPDPIGYGGGMNMYAYVGGDPVNRTDPSGLIPETPCLSSTTSCEPDIRVTGTRTPRGPSARLRDFSLGTSFPQDAGCAYSFADLRDYCFADARRRESDNPYASPMQFASLQDIRDDIRRDYTGPGLAQILQRGISRRVREGLLNAICPHPGSIDFDFAGDAAWGDPALHGRDAAIGAMRGMMNPRGGPMTPNAGSQIASGWFNRFFASIARQMCFGR